MTWPYDHFFLYIHVLQHQRHFVRALTVYPECNGSSLDRGSATRPHFVGSELVRQLHLFASATPNRVQAGRSSIQVAARPNPAVPGGGMPAHHQLPWALSSSFCQRQRLHRRENQYSIGRQKFFCRWTTNLEQSTQHSATAWHGLWTVQTTIEDKFRLSETAAHLWHFYAPVEIHSFTYLLTYLLTYIHSQIICVYRLMWYNRQSHGCWINMHRVYITP